MLCALFVSLPALATISLVQHPSNTACGTSVSTCAVTVTATGVGNAIMVIALFQDTTTQMNLLPPRCFSPLTLAVATLTMGPD